MGRAQGMRAPPAAGSTWTRDARDGAPECRQWYCSPTGDALSPPGQPGQRGLLLTGLEGISLGSLLENRTEGKTTKGFLGACLVFRRPTSRACQGNPRALDD